MRVEYFHFLPKQARQIRISVFMDEQGFTEEFDALDEICTHLVMFDRDIPVATCRIWLAEDGWHVGRLAVIKFYRGRGLGQDMLAPQMLEHCDIRMITPAEIPQYDFCPADKEILELIMKEAKA